MKKTKWPGNWKVRCHVCGFNFPSGEISKRWDGLLVCPDDFETRHPQTLRGPHRTEKPPPFISKDTDDSFTGVCDYFGSMGLSGYGTSGCARTSTYVAGVTLPPAYDPLTGGVPSSSIGSATPPAIYDPSISTDSSVIFLLRGYDAVKEYSKFNRTRTATGASGDSQIGVATASDFFTGTGIATTGTTGTAWIQWDLTTGNFPGGDICIDFWYRPTVIPSVGSVNDRARVLSFYQDSTLVAVIAVPLNWNWFVLGSYGAPAAAVGTRQLISYQAGPSNSNAQSWWNNGVVGGVAVGSSFPAFNKIRVGNDSGSNNAYGVIEELRICTSLKHTGGVGFTPPTGIWP